MHMQKFFDFFIELPGEDIEEFIFIDFDAESGHEDVVENVLLLIISREDLIIAFIRWFEDEHGAIETVEERVEKLGDVAEDLNIKTGNDDGDYILDKGGCFFSMWNVKGEVFKVGLEFMDATRFCDRKDEDIRVGVECSVFLEISRSESVGGEALDKILSLAAEREWLAVEYDEVHPLDDGFDGIDVGIVVDGLGEEGFDDQVHELNLAAIGEEERNELFSNKLILSVHKEEIEI